MGSGQQRLRIGRRNCDAVNIVKTGVVCRGELIPMSAAVRRLKDTLSSDAIAWKGSLTRPGVKNLGVAQDAKAARYARSV